MFVLLFYTGFEFFDIVIQLTVLKKPTAVDVTKVLPKKK